MLFMGISLFLLSSDLNCCILHSPWASLTPQGPFPKDSAWQVPEGTKICPYGAQGCISAFCFAELLHTPDMRAIPAFLQNPNKITGVQVCTDFLVVLLVFWLRLFSYVCLGSSWKGKSVSQ